MPVNDFISGDPKKTSRTLELNSFLSTERIQMKFYITLEQHKIQQSCKLYANQTINKKVIPFVLKQVKKSNIERISGDKKTQQKRSEHCSSIF